MHLELTTLVILGFVGMLAGFVDAIAGGGGLIAVPVLLSVGIPPIAAFGTTKLQSVIGTGMAALTYWRGGYVSLRALGLAIVLTFIGAYSGALAVKSIDTLLLSFAVPMAPIFLIACYFSFAPRLTDADRHARLRFSVFVPVMGLGIGFYDGIFGPGTGSFLTMGLVTLFGLGLTRAAGNTKFLNLYVRISGRSPCSFPRATWCGAPPSPWPSARSPAAISAPSPASASAPG